MMQKSMTHDYPHHIRTKTIAYTATVYAVLIVLLLFKVRQNKPSPPVLDDAIEVNLGNVDDAFGDQPPTTVKGSSSQSAPSQLTSSTPQNAQPKLPTETTQEDDDEIASIVRKEEQQQKQRPNTTYQKEPVKQKNSPTTQQPTTTPTPQKPIALFNGGMENNASGSDYDSYGKEGGNQGVTHGNGDMGVRNGSLSSTNYGSISVVGGLGNRKVLSSPSLREEFSSEGIVQLKVTFNKQGVPTSMVQDIANSTTTQKELVDIAFKNAKKITLNHDENSPNEQMVLFRFIFKISL